MDAISVISIVSHIQISKRVTLTKSKDGEFVFFLNSENGQPVSIVGHTLVKVSLPKTGGGTVDLFAPVTAGVDEVQDIDYDSVPDSGTFKLQFGSELTSALAFNATPGDIQAALRLLNTLSAVTVVGDFTAGHTVTFAGADGKRAQPLIVVPSADNSLKTGTNNVTVTVVETVVGVGGSGITVVSDVATQLKMTTNETNSGLIKVGLGQDMDLTVRVNDRDLNIPPIVGQLDVLESSLS